MKDILITAAVKEELGSFSDKIKVEKVFKEKGIEIIYGNIYGKNVRIVITGPGIFNTVHFLTLAIEQNLPERIIQVGCGGIFGGTGGKTGDIAIADSEIDLQTGIENSDSNIWNPPVDLPFNIIRKDGIYIKNEYPADKIFNKLLIEILSDLYRSDSIQIHSGTFVTASTITSTDERAASVYKKYMPVMESMEGAAAAYSAFLYGIPFNEIRSASNLTGKRDRSKWNLELAFQRCGESLIEILTNLS